MNDFDVVFGYNDIHHYMCYRSVCKKYTPPLPRNVPEETVIFECSRGTCSSARHITLSNSCVLGICKQRISYSEHTASTRENILSANVTLILFAVLLCVWILSIAIVCLMFRTKKRTFDQPILA